jgi:hypothetical protein
MRRAFFDGIAVRTFAVLLAAGAIAVCGGCGGSRGIDTRISGDGTTTRTLANNEVKLEGAMKYHGSGERSYTIEKQCFLDFRARETTSGETTYEIVLTYTGVDELGIEPGRSLEFVADMNSYVLSAEGAAKKQRDPTGDFFTEILVYPISGERLLRMAEAESLQVMVNGRAGKVRGFFDGVNFANLRRFVGECVRPAGPGTSAR